MVLAGVVQLALIYDAVALFDNLDSHVWPQGKASPAAFALGAFRLAVRVGLTPLHGAPARSQRDSLSASISHRRTATTHRTGT